MIQGMYEKVPENFKNFREPEKNQSIRLKISLIKEIHQSILEKLQGLQWRLDNLGAVKFASVKLKKC